MTYICHGWYKLAFIPRWGCITSMRTKVIVWWTLCSLAGSACASDFGSKSSGQACTRTSQCAAGLGCREGLCHALHRREARDAGEPDIDAAEPQVTEAHGM